MKLSHTISLIIGLFLCSTTFCQPKFSNVSDAKKNEIIQNISNASKQNKTLTCDFVQEKTSTLITDKTISKGKMYFKNPHCLRWEYTNSYGLVVNNDIVVVIDSKGVISQTNNTRMFKELANIIMNTIDGSGLNDSKNFTTSVSQSDFEYLVELIPTNKRIANFYKSIQLVVNKQTKLASSITMFETNGDSMKITFSNHKTNQPFDQKLFNVQ